MPPGKHGLRIYRKGINPETGHFDFVIIERGDIFTSPESDPDKAYTLLMTPSETKSLGANPRCTSAMVEVIASVLKHAIMKYINDKCLICDIPANDPRSHKCLDLEWERTVSRFFVNLLETLPFEIISPAYAFVLVKKAYSDGSPATRFLYAKTKRRGEVLSKVMRNDITLTDGWLSECAAYFHDFGLLYKKPARSE